jgi:uncharacterized repeat protein (TIGR01451 family)
MKKLTSLLAMLVVCSITLQAQIVRPFGIRYNNPSVKGNIVYVSNNIVTTSGSTGTGEVPPAGTSTNNAGAGVYLNIESTPTTFISYGATWKYYNHGSGPASWNQTSSSDAAWSSGATEIGFGGGETTTITGQGTFVNNSGTANDYYTGGIYTAYFRKAITIANPALFSGFTLNLTYDDGAVVYVNGTEVGRISMPAGAIAYTTSASANNNNATTTFSIPASAFVAGTNVIAVEVHRSWVLNAGVDRMDRDGTLSFNAQLIGTPITTVTSATSADLSLAACSKILWAGLYWGADQGTSGTNSAWMTGAENSIKLKIPGSSTYTTITSTQTNKHDATSSSLAGFNHTGYTAFAEITSLVNTTNPNGTYTVADMLAPVTINNVAGGWTIVFVFENLSLTPKNLTVFDGHVIVDGGASPIDINITGFLTPSSGTVSCELGGVVYDGDRVSQDAFQFKQNGAPSFYDLATPTAYALNNTADAWNSKISYKGSVVTTRNPAHNNTLGYDATILDLPNAGNAQLSNSQTAAVVRFSSPSENYIVHVLTTSISQFNPEFQLTKSATDVNGATLVGGDVLRYRVDYQNLGNDISTNSIILDNIPSGTTYKPGTLNINGTIKTDVSGDDQAEFDAANNRVVFRIGTGATSAAGGQVAVNASGYIEFDVYVPKSCSVLSCANPIANSARVNYVGATSAASLYDSSGTSLAGCFTLGPVSSTVTGSCYAPLDTFLLNQCPSTSVTFPIQQYGGYRFYSAMPFIDANAINPAATYSSTRIIYAYWNNGVCSDTVAIRIYITPCPDIDDDNDGIPDYVEANNATALGDHDSDGVPNYSDAQYPGYVDYNSDGMNDLFDPSADADNDGTPNFLDPNYAGYVDSNGDGVDDNLDADLDGIPNHLDLDSDNDGIPDVAESYGVDADGDGRIDNYSDTDNDGLSQNVDGNNTGAVGSGTGLGNQDIDGDGLRNYLELDSDNDGIPDIIEAGGVDGNNNGMVDTYTDADGDGLHDSYDGDAGNDNVAENAVNTLLRTSSDANNDGRCDSYPYRNIDKDLKPNPYDLDSDGDGLTDVIEAGFTDADYDSKADGGLNAKGWNTTISALGALNLPNRDATGAANAYDIDSDDDGIPDNIEGQLTTGYMFASGTDTDGDGIDNTYDNILGFGGRVITPCDTDGDTWPDYLDFETDGDGLSDLIEGNDLNLNKLPDDNIVLTGTDTDMDGLDDFFDLDNTSADGTSAYMGNGGSFTGDPTPGSKTTVQRSFAQYYDRDWRSLEYVLNLNFVEFKGVLQNNRSQLRFTVVNQTGIDHYILERSIDRTKYADVSTIGANTSVDKMSYQAVDDISNLAAANYYYRIRAVFKDGKKKTSSVLVLNTKTDNLLKVQVTPVPVQNEATISVQSKSSGTANFVLIDMHGRSIEAFDQTVQAGTNVFNMDRISSLPNGVYYLNVSLNGIMSSFRFNIIR